MPFPRCLPSGLACYSRLPAHFNRRVYLPRRTRCAAQCRSPAHALVCLRRGYEKQCFRKGPRLSLFPINDGDGEGRCPSRVLRWAVKDGARHHTEVKWNLAQLPRERIRPLRSIQTCPGALIEEEKRKRREAEAYRKREIERRMKPRTREDFEILYSELEAWRLQETRRIKESTLSEEEKQLLLRQLLHKETKLLQTIDRLKITASKANRADRIEEKMQAMAAPKKWPVRKGDFVDVQTPTTIRASELMQLYHGLLAKGLGMDERLDVLLHVKWTVKEFDCELTQEIISLVDREADLLNRGRSMKALEGMRKRIAFLFLQFMEIPEFNPEAAAYEIIIPDDTVQDCEKT
ncbi:hypothetical protein CBR_g29814 [Chara braunii]|uniref:IQ motif and ubiquitin-like domain-containing protein n=1 Tax=Chara braunii TaxID=69332 RepID=A0A388LBJ6_CHABU|nr:hypothetical protein CBR_g29814 [Chara braunii]|eukprot:GBG79666.1 hypothetical protein CBR_g29814 [Chara braunii]